MDKGKFVDQLTPGSSFTNSLFIVVSPDIKQGKAGSPYAMFNIEDRTGTASAKLWNVTPDQTNLLATHTFFLMNGNVESGTYSGQVTVSSIRPVAESDVNMDDFLAPLPPDHQVHYDRFIRLVRSVKNPHLKSLLRNVFNSADTLKRFKDAVAAKNMHHAHRGGLIEHSSEVAEMCEKMCDVLPGLNRDLLVTCALLHDIGKLDEMEHGVKHGDYTEDGVLIGHIVLGTQIILSGMGADFPPALRRMVMHLILSHHGTGEFGSPKEPATAEAYVLSSCDELSAKVFQTRHAALQARPGQINVKTPNGWAFVGDFGFDDATSSDNSRLSKDTALSFEVESARLPIVGTDEVRDVTLPNNGADYLLRVRTNSLDASGVLPGDLVFVKRNHPLKDQALVAVRLDGEDEQVRRLALDKSGQRVLESDNPKFPTVPMSSEEIVAGTVTGLIREL